METLEETLNTRINEAISFVSAIGGVDDAFIEKTMQECERMRSEELLSRLKQIAKEAPAQFKRNFDTVVPLMDKLVFSEKEGDAANSHLGVLLIGVVYAIIFLIFSIILLSIFHHWLFEPIWGRIPDPGELRDMYRISLVISGFVVFGLFIKKYILPILQKKK